MLSYKLIAFLLLFLTSRTKRFTPFFLPRVINSLKSALAIPFLLYSGCTATFVISASSREIHAPTNPHIVSPQHATRYDASSLETTSLSASSDQAPSPMAIFSISAAPAASEACISLIM